VVERCFRDKKSPIGRIGLFSFVKEKSAGYAYRSPGPRAGIARAARGGRRADQSAGRRANQPASQGGAARAACRRADGSSRNAADHGAAERTVLLCSLTTGKRECGGGNDKYFAHLCSPNPRQARHLKIRVVNQLSPFGPDDPRDKGNHV